jgi:hypothetical protein
MKWFRTPKSQVKNACGIMNSQKSSVKQDRMLPATVAAVLRIRDCGDNKCPEEILRRIESLKIGKVVYNFKGQVASPVSQTPTNSFAGTSNSSASGWRKPQAQAHQQSSGQGYRQSSSWERPLAIRRVPSNLSSPRPEQEDNRRFHKQSASSPTPATQNSQGSQGSQCSPQSPSNHGQAPHAFPPGGRYVSSIVSDKKVEDRIIGHIRSKLNKFSTNNYDSVKSFLEQIMDSGETDFLTEFMDMLFTKAAAEDMFCELYSRLLSELTQKFPHLVSEISKIYSNFIAIFQEARDVPDQSSADYKKFLDAQQRKKFRNGYSHFLAEIYNRNLLPQDAIEVTIKIILESLSVTEKDANNTLLVEEYLTSLHKIISTIHIVKSPPYPPYIDNMVDALKKIIAKPKDETTGYTVKSRFKIMDILDLLPN